MVSNQKPLIRQSVYVHSPGGLPPCYMHSHPATRIPYCTIKTTKTIVDFQIFGYSKIQTTSPCRVPISTKILKLRSFIKFAIIFHRIFLSLQFIYISKFFCLQYCLFPLGLFYTLQPIVSV